MFNKTGNAASLIGKKKFMLKKQRPACIIPSQGNKLAKIITKPMTKIVPIKFSIKSHVF